VTDDQQPAVPDDFDQLAAALTARPNPGQEALERGEWIRAAFQRIVAVALGQVARELLEQSADSTALSFQDKALAAMIRPQVPRLQRLLLSRLSDLDPVALEETLGALATSFDELLAAAPGQRLPRLVFRFDPVSGSFVMAPADG
jgi:hypothetical protein